MKTWAAVQHATAKNGAGLSNILLTPHVATCGDVLDATSCGQLNNQHGPKSAQIKRPTDSEFWKQSRSEQLELMDSRQQFENIEGLNCMCDMVGGQLQLCFDLSVDSGWTARIVGIK